MQVWRWRWWWPGTGTVQWVYALREGRQEVGRRSPEFVWPPLFRTVFFWLCNLKIVFLWSLYPCLGDLVKRTWPNLFFETFGGHETLTDFFLQIIVTIKRNKMKPQKCRKLSEIKKLLMAGPGHCTSLLCGRGALLVLTCYLGKHLECFLSEFRSQKWRRTWRRTRLWRWIGFPVFQSLGSWKPFFVPFSSSLSKS